MKAAGLERRPAADLHYSDLNRLLKASTLLPDTSFNTLPVYAGWQFEQTSRAASDGFVDSAVICVPQFPQV